MSTVAHQIAKWLLVAAIAAGSVFTMTKVGKPREPLTVDAAAVSVVANVLLIVAIVVWW